MSRCRTSPRPPARPSLARIVALTLAAAALPAALHAQQQQNDSAYTAKIHQYLSDPRISTELVDHLPASSTVPTPLKFLGRIVGTPGELTHAADIARYMQAVANASPRAKFWTIGKTEEGRDMVMIAIADSATIAHLDQYKGYLNQLTDPRKTSEAEAQRLIHTAKPIYWLTSGIHSPEFGGPEMLMELAYRLAVEETPLVQDIRKNVITFITPVVEVDGRERAVDNYYWNKKYRHTIGNLPLMYWGKYVQHDNNRDGMGQFLDLTKNTTRVMLEWTPTILHDLHEAQTYLYASTGTGPYNEWLDPITIDEWWTLAENDVLEMTKRGVPGVWTYGYYDGWVPNYLFFIANTHNAVGRFYEVQSYGPDPYVVRPGRTTTSREWFRPNPPLDSINWSARANTNIQESALLLALHRVAVDHQTFLENYWIKNKRSVEKGRTGPIFAWVIPANQHAKQNAAEAVNDLRTQGLEIQRATAPFRAGNVDVKAGDYIVRADQPYRTLADMYFALQNFSTANPSPYDDTGWTFPLMRNITLTAIGDSSILTRPMTPITTAITADGGISGNGRVVVVDNTSDNTLVSLRFKLPAVRMQAAEAPFDAAGHHFTAGAFIIPNADRTQLDPLLRQLGLSGYAMASAPAVKTHDLDVPRIGYVHSWTRTQDEGWVRAALDHYGVPYDYFGEPLLKQGNLRAKYDVIIYPYGGTGLGANTGGFRGRRGDAGPPPPTDKPVPYRHTAEFPSLGYPDSTDDVRGGAGAEGLKALYDFVDQGGTLITEGNTATNLIELKFTPGITVENASGLFARGTILRGVIADHSSPLVYGYDGTELPIYFNQGPVLNAGAGAVPIAEVASDSADAGGRGGRTSSIGQNTTPMATRLDLSAWDPDHDGRAYGMVGEEAASDSSQGRGRGGRGFGGRANAEPPSIPGFTPDANSSARVVLQFPASANDMLLSGTLEHGELLSRRAQLVDESVGKGHMVIFAIRPFWRWQTQGSYALGFNAIMNWNDLGAGK